MGSRARARGSSAPAGATASARPEGIQGYLAQSDAKDLDRLIYERVRLGIVSALSVNKVLSFSELKSLLDTTDGNLGAHARKLEDAGYVGVTKSFEGRVPRTVYRLTARGRKAFTRYLDHMEALIDAAKAQ